MAYKIAFPPSINDMYLNNKGRGRGRIKSPEYRLWCGVVGMQLKAQKAAPYIGRAFVTIVLDERRQGDCDSRLKSVLDALVANKILVDDRKKYLRGASIEWGDVSECQVTIEAA